MTSKRTRVAGSILASALAVSALAACSSSGNSNSGNGNKTGSSGGSSAGSTANTTSKGKGGTIYYLTKRSVEHWDPQRMYVGRDLADASRLFSRTLLQLGTGTGADSNKLHPDLATDLGTHSADNKTWSWTLKNNVKWQDGSTVTCADLKYGVSRGFATDIITGGPNYALQFLNIPAETNPTAAKMFPSAYHGPYNKVGQALFDKAVVCQGQKITFYLKKSVPDFDYTVSAALQEFAPYKQSQDKGAKSNYSIFSDGPYMLQGSWTEMKGGTFVRNPQYDPSTDDTTIRKALPDKFVFVEGLTTEGIFDRLLKDSGPDQYAVTDRAAPPAYLARVAAVKDRFTAPLSPFVDYLVPNFKKLTNPKVRQALALATNRQSYISAEGGPAVADVAYGLVNPALGADAGYKKFDAFPDQGVTGNPSAAKKLLQEAGVKIPYPITFVYQGGTPTSDNQAAALKASWDQAGFNTKLEGLPDTYYNIVQNPAKSSSYDVVWGGWGADWPSASTVIPPLFDSRVNLTDSSNGQDYGLYQSNAVNAAIDKAYATSDATSRNQQWGDLDEMLAKDVAYIPLDIVRFPRLHGSKVTNYVESASTNGYPDLGQVGANG